MISDALAPHAATASLGVPREPPGPRGRRLLGSLDDVRRSKLRFVTRVTRDFGDIVGFQMGPRRLYLLTHPAHFKHVLHDNAANYHKGLGLTDAAPLLGEGLLTSDGERWARQRARLQGAFAADRLESYASRMTELTLALARRWRAPAIAGQPVEVVSEMARLALQVVGATLLRVDLSARADAITADLGAVARWAMRRMAALVKTPYWLPTPRNLAARAAVGRLERLVANVVDERRQAGHEADGDFLSVLLAAAEEDGAAGQRQLRDELLTILLAGHETTAATLGWTWYLLSQHPEVEGRLHDELASVLGGTPPTFADLPRLVYTRRVVEEVLRLYPPVWMLPRKALADDCVEGYRIARHADVLLSVYSLHRHPAIWEQPERFDPERFQPERSARRGPYSYLPFGAGPRTCLGTRFGLMEALLVIAVLAQEYRLERAQDGPVEPDPALTLRPRHALPMRLRPRRA